MAVIVRNEVEYDHYFDRTTKRHSINGIQSVLHCHHYSALYTQLAIDAGETDLLQRCAHDSFRKVLGTYFEAHPLCQSLQRKTEIACQYYALLGLGTMKVIYLGEDSGEFSLLSSHIDSGWIKKWGKYDKPVNYITAGYIEALIEAVLDLPANSFNITETGSIVMGAEVSTFKAVRR